MAASGIHEPAIPGVRHACPCCGYPTLGKRGGYEICELCDWEDDGQDDPHADEEWGGPNGHYSLTDARRNFRRHGTMYSPDEPAGGRATTNHPAELRAKREIIEAFDGMVGGVDGRAVHGLWRRVVDGEQALREARGYEARENPG